DRGGADRRPAARPPALTKKGETMSYTPVEIRHVKLRRGLAGYRREPVDLLEGELKRYRELEGLLRATLVSAERAAHELRDQANREAESIVSEARAESRTITRNARS